MTQQVTVEGLALICEPIEVEYPVDGGFKLLNLKPGDTVIGRRNTGWKIGTVSQDLWDKTLENGWMYCDEISFYPFGFDECLKVLEIKE